MSAATELLGGFLIGVSWWVWAWTIARELDRCETTRERQHRELLDALRNVTSR